MTGEEYGQILMEINVKNITNAFYNMMSYMYKVYSIIQNSYITNIVSFNTGCS
jgi:hypothetical protein